MEILQQKEVMETSFKIRVRKKKSLSVLGDEIVYCCMSFLVSWQFDYIA